jgi:hypothetical protein
MTMRRAAALLLPLAVLLSACNDLNGPGGAVPVVDLSAPTDGTVLTADSLIVTGVVSDDRMVVRVTTQLTQATSRPEVEIPFGMARASAFSATVRDLPAGDFSLTVRAYDAEGRSGERTVALQRP